MSGRCVFAMTWSRHGACVMTEISKDPEAFRWSRVATVAAVLLIHAGFVGLLLLPMGAWRLWGAKRSSVQSDALSLRFIAMPLLVPIPPRPHVLPPTHATASTRRPRIAASEKSEPPSPSASDTSIPPSPVDDASGSMPAYIPGGGRFAADPGFTRDNVHLPGGAQPVRGAPVLRMADPKMQGIAGAVRTVQRLFGIPDSHCVDVDVWRGMTTSERIAKHIDDARIEETAARYHCGS